MRDDIFPVDELKQEENLVSPETAEAQPEEIAAEVVPETVDPENAAAETEAPAEEAGEDQSEKTAETPAEPTAAEDSKALPYHERYYLKYREGKRSTPLDLEGTRAFLNDLGFDGGELRQARKGKDYAENFHNADRGNTGKMFCSYCGMEISGVEFNHLNDNRVRCTFCSSTLVKTKAEAEEIFQRVVDNMANFFGAVLEVPVSVEILDERKLKRRVFGRLDGKDLQSVLILGCAIKKKNKYTILLENGAPRISTIATFAHELTHIWQYTHWDKKKSAKRTRRRHPMVYEGMAKWAEIQYLYLIGETAVAKREESITRDRQDEYGVGFRLYEDHYPLSRGAMSCDITPFSSDDPALD